MPIFEYVCKECQHEFEALVFGKQKAECPKCQSKKLEPQLSVFAVSAKRWSERPAVFLGGALRVVRRRSRGGGLLAEGFRLSPSLAGFALADCEKSRVSMTSP
jgi:putative FmdB family regulatory protein